MNRSSSLRRIAAVASLTMLGIAAGPLVGVANATPTLAASGLSPASGAYVKTATTVSACYTGTLAAISNITVTMLDTDTDAQVPVAGTTGPLGSCNSGTSNKITWTPQNTLADGSYTATAHAS